MKKNIFKSLVYVTMMSAPLFIASCDEFGTDDNPAGAYISMDTSDVTLDLGKGYEKTSTCQRTGIVATDAFIEYSSTDEKVATVDASTGLVTAVGGGTCNIVAKPYFIKNGSKLYTKEELKYSVKVNDWRARIALKEGAKIPIYNSAMAKTVEEIDMKPLLDVVKQFNMCYSQIRKAI